MSAKPRDLLKTRRTRLANVAREQALGAGQANGQYPLWGCTLAPHTVNTQLAVSAGEVFLAQALTAFAALGAIVINPAAATAAGQARKVAVDVKSDGTVVQTLGALAPDGTQATAVLPQTPIDSITVGWLELTGVFTPGTTALTGAMCKQMPYDSGVN